MLQWNGMQWVDVPDMAMQMSQYGAQMQGQYRIPMQVQPPNYGANNAPNNAPKLNTNIIRVFGIEGARNYPLPNFSEMVLFDNDKDIVYKVSVDGTGKKEVVMLDLSEHREEPPIDFSTFATKDDIAELRKEFSKKKEKE